MDLTRETHLEDEGGGTATTTKWPEWESCSVENILYHPDERVDVAVFRCPEFMGPAIQLDATTNALAFNEFLMQEILVLGYPPIPLAKSPFIVCHRGEVAAVIEDYFSGRRHFVLSGTPRGGFSGGVALPLTHPIRTLGIITTASVRNGQEAELGYMTALNSGLIFELLDHEGVRIKLVEMTKAGYILTPSSDIACRR